MIWAHLNVNLRGIHLNSAVQLRLEALRITIFSIWWERQFEYAPECLEEWSSDHSNVIYPTKTQFFCTVLLRGCWWGLDNWGRNLDWKLWKERAVLPPLKKDTQTSLLLQQVTLHQNQLFRRSPRFCGLEGGFRLRKSTPRDCRLQAIRLSDQSATRGERGRGGQQAGVSLSAHTVRTRLLEDGLLSKRAAKRPLFSRKSIRTVILDHWGSGLDVWGISDNA